VWAASSEQPFVIVARKAWLPPTDVYETPQSVVIKMELAGVSEGDLHIAITGDILSVGGQRRDPAAGHKIGYHHLGITYGEFVCDIRLPGPVARDAIVAEYEAGFLTITLPKIRPASDGPVYVQINS
jgi:HSP20 family protein